MRGKFIFIAMLGGLSLSCVNRVQAAATIDTYSTWTGWAYGSLFGEGTYFGAPTIATEGQTFVAPTGNPILTGFNIWMENLSQSTVFGVDVMAWTGTRAIGPVLYDSGRINLPTGSDWKETSLNMNVPLNPEQQYVFIVSESTFFDGQAHAAYMAATPGYPDSYGVYLGNGSDTSQWTTSDWGKNGGGWGLVFQAQFVPEPSGCVLLMMGIVTKCLYNRAVA